MAGVHAPVSHRLIEISIAWSIGALKIILLFALQRLMRSRLHGRTIDGICVCLIWLILDIAGLVLQSQLSMITMDRPLTDTVTLGWILTWWFEHLVLAGLFSLRAQYLSIIARSGQGAVTAAAQAADQQLATTQIHSWMQASLQSVHDALDRTAATVPTDDALRRWKKWSEKTMALATGAIRKVGHQAHEYRVDLTTPRSHPEAKHERVSSAVGIRELLLYYGKYSPITVIPVIVLLPLMLQIGVSSSIINQPSAWALLAWIVLGNIALVGLTKRRAFYFAPAAKQWVVTVVGLCVIGFAVWPIGKLLGTPEVLQFLGDLHRGAQAWMLTIALLGLNISLGFTAVYIAHIRLLAAQSSSNQFVIREEADLLLAHNISALDDVASRVHSTLQGRLVAMALMANDVSNGDRDADQARQTILRELATLTDELPSLIQRDPSVLAPSNITSGLVEDVVSAWKSAINLRIVADPAVNQLLVPADLELALGRIAAEAISNAVRHGWARNCTITVIATETVGTWIRVAQIIVSDDGAGNTGSSARSSKRSGIGTQLLNQYTDGQWQLDLLNSGAVLRATVRTQSQPVIQLDDADVSLPVWE